MFEYEYDDRYDYDDDLVDDALRDYDDWICDCPICTGRTGTTRLHLQHLCIDALL